MVKQFRQLATMVSLGALAFVGCTHSTQQLTSSDATSEFSNLDRLEVVELLPSNVADARIRYDDAPLTFGDLRIPDNGGDETYPLVILIHGGAWESSFTLDYVAPLAESLTEQGFATWNLEYERINNPDGGYPGTFQDISRGVDFVEELAENYPLDLERVVILGHSSGGHLATWAAGRNNIPSKSNLNVSEALEVQGVIDLAGVLDLKYAYNSGRDDVVDLLETEDSNELEARFAETSSIDLLPFGVPQTIIVGTEDDAWRQESHANYKEKGERLGDEVTLVQLEGANHFDVVDPCSPVLPYVFEAAREYTDMQSVPNKEDSNTSSCSTK